MTKNQLNYVLFAALATLVLSLIGEVSPSALDSISKSAQIVALMLPRVP